MRKEILLAYLKVLGKSKYEDLTAREKAVLVDILEDHKKGIESQILSWSTDKYKVFLQWQKSHCLDFVNLEDSTRNAYLAEFENWYWSVMNSI